MPTGQYSLAEAKPISGGTGQYRLADAQAAPKQKGFIDALADYNPIPGIRDFIVGKDPATGRAGGPIQGAMNMVNGAIDAGVEQARKASEEFKQGHYVEAAGHAGAAVLPVVGPAAANAGEEIGAGRAAEGLGHATGLLASVVAPEVVSKVAGKAPVPPAVTSGAENALRSSAETQYSRVLAPTTKVNKFLTKAAVPELIDRGVVAPTLKNLQAQAGAHISSIGAAIGDAWDNLPAGTKTDFHPIYDRLQAAIDDVHSIPDSTGKLIPKGPQAETAIGNITKLQQTLLDVAEADPATGTLQIPVEKVRGLRQYFDDIAARAGRYGGKDLADQSASEAHGIAADSIRENLASDHPDIAALNKEYSFWKNVHQVVTDTVERKTGQSKPLGQQLMRAGGFIKGGPLGAELMDRLTQAARSPAWGTVSAVLKDRLADAIASGNRTATQFYVEKIGQAAGAVAISAQEPQTAALAGAGSQ